MKQIIRHCYYNVPYYHEQFKTLQLKPADIKTKNDLHKLPLLTKEILQKNFRQLQAKNLKKYHPYLCRTSGTTGEPVCFYLDKNTMILEFCYYWRYWSWAGYKLRKRFAEFSLHHFVNSAVDTIIDYRLLTNRIVLNPAQLSFENVHTYIKGIKKYNPQFLKGTPTVLNIFATLVERSGCRDLSFKAVFTTGEKILQHHRENIEKVFSCKIVDSYAHMERTMAVSQCPLGRYHVHSEYGILQVEEEQHISSPKGTIIGEVIGTSLHNYAMPFIRYKTGDLITVLPEEKPCKCGRKLPLIKEIHGRSQDIIITPDGRFIANIFIVFNFIDGILWYKVIQENRENIQVKLIIKNGYSRERIAQQIREYFNKIFTMAITISIDFLSFDDISLIHKNRVVESKVTMEEFL